VTWQQQMKLAEKAFEKGEFVIAENCLWEALKDAELFGSTSIQMVETAERLAEAMIAQHKTQDAEDLLLRLAELKTQALGPNSRSMADTLMKLAELYYGLAKYSQAEPFALRSLRIYESIYGREHEESAKIGANVAFIFHAAGKFPQAEEIYKRLLDFRKTLPHAENDPEIPILLRSYASLLQATDRNDEAEKMVQSADQLASRSQ